MKWKVLGSVAIPLLLVLASLAFDFAVLLAIGLVSMAGQLWLSGQLAEERSRVPDVDRSMFDPTTNLLSPWYYGLRVNEEAKRCDRYGRSMAVIVMKVLLPNGLSEDWRAESAAAAQRCAKVVRSVDLIGALAPFELGFCLLECDRAAAREVYGRLVQELLEYECLGGIAVYPGDALSAGELVKVARERSLIPRAA